jgi:hypothetical protein
MAGTTSNYGFPYPTSTDYVRNGATAIQSLADGLDAFISDSEAANKLFDRVLNTQSSTAYSRSVSSTGFVTLNSPASLTYSITLGKSGVALISFGGNINGATAAVNYFVGLDVTGASISGFGAAQGTSIATTGTGRGGGAATILVDGTAGGTVTVAIQGKSSSATASIVTLNDHYITAVLLG